MILLSVIAFLIARSSVPAESSTVISVSWAFLPFFSVLYLSYRYAPRHTPSVIAWARSADVAVASDNATEEGNTKATVFAFAERAFFAEDEAARRNCSRLRDFRSPIPASISRGDLSFDSV